MTYPILDLTDELDVVLGYEWCKDHQRYYQLQG